MQWVEQSMTAQLETVIEERRQHHDREKGLNDPATFDEFKQKALTNPLNTSAASYLDRLIGSNRVVLHLANMRWTTARFDNLPHSLLTSDRPIIMTNGIGAKDAHLAIPLAPNRLFLACNTETVERQIRSTPSKELCAQINSLICEQARQFVYGVDDSQLTFVRKRLGKRKPSSPLG